jgi:transmembrane sensor
MERRQATDAEREASHWIARLEAADVTLEDHQRFRAWLNAVPENRAAHEAVSRSWDQLDALKLLPSQSFATPNRPLSRRALLFGAGGAAAIASAALLVWGLTPQTTFAATYTTQIGGRETATLADGSQIELNADTSLRVSFTKEMRSAHLDRGEALFTITDDGRPFEVQTPFGNVRARGTIFLIRIGVNAARASVLEGSVSGHSSDSAPGQASANQELVLTRNTVASRPIEVGSAAQRLAWRNHMLAFDGDTLAEAALDVERQTGIRFTFATADVAALRVGGYIDGRDANSFARLIETNLRLPVRRESERAFIVGE